MAEARDPRLVPHYIESARLGVYELIKMAALPGAMVMMKKLASSQEDARLTATELAEPGMNITYLERLLRLGRSSKVLSEVVDEGTGARRYGLQPLGKLFLSLRHGEDFEFISLLYTMYQPANINPWNYLPEPFAHAKDGLHILEYGEHDEHHNKNIKDGVMCMAAQYMFAVVNAYPAFGNLNTLVDVGGGDGTALALIIDRHRHIRGINFDLPHVLPSGPIYSGVKNVGGNFFESLPSGNDAILLKSVLHNWSDENCLKILMNCYKALPDHGKVIVIDNMLPEGEGDDPTFRSDVSMMLLTFHPGARERTESEVRRLAHQAGFRQFVNICKVDYYIVTELRKA